MNYMDTLSLFKTFIRVDFELNSITHKWPVIYSHLFHLMFWHLLSFINLVSGFCSLCFLFLGNFSHLSQWRINIRIIPIILFLIEIVPIYTIKEWVFLNFLSSIETQSCHRVSNHKFWNQISCLWWHTFRELNSSSSDIFV